MPYFLGVDEMTMDEARGVAARIWCEPQHAGKVMDVEFAESIARKLSEVSNWEESARLSLKGLEYYRGLVVKIGELFGDAAKTADDGGVHEGVLCAKVPELVEGLFNEVRPAVVVQR